MSLPLVSHLSFIAGLIAAGTVFLLAQLAVIAIWTYLYQRRRKQRAFDESSTTSSGYTNASGPLGGSTLPSLSVQTRTDSLCKLYDGGINARHPRHF